MLGTADLSRALDELRAIARSEDTLHELDAELDAFLAGNPAAEYMMGEPA
jgi:hypothetical protein